MHKKIIKLVSVLMMVVLFATTAVSVDISAATASEIQSEINDLEQQSKKLEA